MFDDDNVIKMKKEQFVEAESVAYLIKDEQKRKLAFANTCGLFVFKNYVEKHKYKYEPITNINLFRVPMIAEKYGISDLYLGDARIDVRVSLDGEFFPIPKSHISKSLVADFYVIYKGTKNPLKCEGLGYIRKEDLIFDFQDEEYYYISVKILNPLADLKSEINNFTKETKSFYETEHKISQENFGAFLDGELDEIKTLDTLEHLINCSECRGLFVEYSFLEDVLTSLKHYPDLQQDVENALKEAEMEEEKDKEEEKGQAEEERKEEAKEEAKEEVVADITTEIEAPIEITDEAINEDLNETLLESEETLIQTDFSDEDSIITESINTEEELTENTEPLLQEEPSSTEIEDTTEESLEIDTSDENEMPVLLYEDTSSPETTESEDNDTTEIMPQYNFNHQTETQEEKPEIQNLQEETLNLDTDFLDINDEDNIITDDYTIVETDTNAENPDETTNDEELNNFIVNDINDSSMEISFEDESISLDNTEENNNSSFEETSLDNETSNDTENTIAFESNFDEEDDNNFQDFVNENTTVTEEESTISFEDIFNEDSDIEIEANTAKSLQEDEELNNILNDDFNENDEEASTSNWNQLFTTNASSIIEQEPESITPPVFEAEDNAQNNENIEALYDTPTENKNDNTNDIDKLIEETATLNTEPQKEDKKNSNTLTIVVIASLAIVLTTLGGIIYYGFNLTNNQNNISKNPNEIAADNYENIENTMDKVITDAFSEEMQNVTVTKMTWNKSKSTTITKKIETYLQTTASSVWDVLDESLLGVQSNKVTQPAKINILIDKNGEPQNIKIAQSCGENSIDEIILQSVKNYMKTTPPSKDSIKGENLNLTLVVNF